MAPQVVQALRVLCNGERNPAPFKIQEISSDDPIFHGEGSRSPLSILLKIPILVRKDKTPAGFGRAQLDNQPITYLMINPASGLAPAEWQQGIGSVIIARQDKKPFLGEHFECLWDYISNVIIEEFGEGDDSEAERFMCKQEFEDYWNSYKESRDQKAFKTALSPYQL